MPQSPCCKRGTASSRRGIAPAWPPGFGPPGVWLVRAVQRAKGRARPLVLEVALYYSCMATTGAEVHRYASRLSWRGTTASGWETYDREHHIEVPPAKDTLTITADAAFRGDANRLNPEQLLLAAASSCQLLSFLARAARAGVDVRCYEDHAEASMDMSDKPPRINHVRLAPTIEVAPATDIARVEKLVARAHAACFIANSLSSTMEIDPTIRYAA
jgi:organic hydroperoxide reductase OsmC/OhrA